MKDKKITSAVALVIANPREPVMGSGACIQGREPEGETYAINSHYSRDGASDLG